MKHSCFHSTTVSLWSSGAYFPWSPPPPYIFLILIFGMKNLLPQRTWKHSYFLKESENNFLSPILQTQVPLSTDFAKTLQKVPLWQSQKGTSHHKEKSLHATPKSEQLHTTAHLWGGGLMSSGATWDNLVYIYVKDLIYENPFLIFLKNLIGA